MSIELVIDKPPITLPFSERIGDEIQIIFASCSCLSKDIPCFFIIANSLRSAYSEVIVKSVYLKNACLDITLLSSSSSKNAIIALPTPVQ